jgi:RNA polymerase sigma-70 factor, ECF subfamily
MTHVDECSVDLRALVDAAKSGDQAAFGDLYRRYEPTIRSYIARRVGNWCVVQDITQDVFRRAWMSLPSYEHRGRDFSAFLTTIARNGVYDHYKSAVSRTTVPVPVAAMADRAEEDRFVNPEYRAVLADTSTLLSRAIGRLSDDQQACVRLRFLQGLSVAETAAALGRNEGAVKALQSRAASNLRRDPELEALR